MNIFVKLSEWFYHFRCKYIFKFTTVKVRTLEDRIYHPSFRVLVHVIFQVLTNCADSIQNEELKRINFWWHNIYQVKSDILIEKLTHSQNYSGNKQFMRDVVKSSVLMEDLYTNMHYIIDHIMELE